MHGFWGVFWLAVVLKIPIAALLGIIWWAVRNPPAPELEREEGDGGSKSGPHPRMRPPHPPRRGPHGDPAPVAPTRVRATRRGPRVPER